MISASRLSRTGEGDGTLNLRGISTVLSLASFLKGEYISCSTELQLISTSEDYSLWAKDIIFVISDGYLDGMQAWITTYHGLEQNSQLGFPFI